MKLDVPTSCDMRAPGAATGVDALECAMDELAIALKTDPVQLRLRCYSDRDQAEDMPYTSKQLRECYRQGAAEFGWNKRNPEPRSMREGSELVGWGMTGVWEALQMPATVRIVLTANGHAEVATAASDIGTGTYTIIAQVAADMPWPADHARQGGSVRLSGCSGPEPRRRRFKPAASPYRRDAPREAGRVIGLDSDAGERRHAGRRFETARRNPCRETP